MSTSENEEKEIFEKYARQAIVEAIENKVKNGKFHCEKRKHKDDPESLCKSVLGILYELIITGKNQAYNNIINDKDLKEGDKYLKKDITTILEAYSDKNIEIEFNIKDKKFNKHLQEEKFKTLRKIRDHVVNPPTILRPMSFFNGPTRRSRLRSANGGKRRNTRRRNRKSNKTRKYKSRSRR